MLASGMAFVAGKPVIGHSCDIDAEQGQMEHHKD